MVTFWKLRSRRRFVINTIIIKEARPEDAAQVLEYLKTIGGETDNLSFGAEGLPFTVEEEAAYLQCILDDPRCVSYLAWQDGRIVGDGSLNALPRRMGHRAELGLSVIREYWDRGVGSALLQKLIAFARESGTELINLEVRQDNLRAIHVYEKFGFQTIGVSPAFCKLGDAYADYLLMYLDLREAK